MPKFDPDNRRHRAARINVLGGCATSIIFIFGSAIMTFFDALGGDRHAWYWLVVGFGLAVVATVIGIVVACCNVSEA